jgi:hypothetical protein
MLNRARKAALIANVLRDHGATAATAEALPAVGRFAAVTLAGVGEPSEQTWAAVLGILDSDEHARPTQAPNVAALVGERA